MLSLPEISLPEQKRRSAHVHYVQLLLPLCVELPGSPASSLGTGTIEWAWWNYSICSSVLDPAVLEPAGSTLFVPKPVCLR